MAGDERCLCFERVAAELEDVRVVGHIPRQLVKHLPDRLRAALTGPGFACPGFACPGSACPGHRGGQLGDLVADPVQVGLRPGQDRVRVCRRAERER